MRSLDREINKYEDLLLVDGYNIINSWDSFKSNKTMEESRKELKIILEDYQAYIKSAIILVYDSYNVKEERQIIIDKNIILVYTKQGETADHFIEKLTSKYGKKKNIQVATSDRVEQDLILGSGASRVSAKELEILIKEARDDIKSTQKFINTKNELHLTGLSEETKMKLERIKEKFKDRNR